MPPRSWLRSPLLIRPITDKPTPGAGVPSAVPLSAINDHLQRSMGRAARGDRHPGDILVEPMRKEAGFDDPELSFRNLLSDHEKKPLSLQATEDALPERVREQLHLAHWYDIDSTIIELRSLHAIPGVDFFVSFVPPHATSSSRNAHVELSSGRALHKNKNLHLGSFDLDRSSPVHIAFLEELETELSTTYPSHHVQRTFVDECLLPAIRSACPPRPATAYARVV